MIFAAIAELEFEKPPDSSIKTAQDPFWWAFVTVTTVGYGDKVPLSTEGRIAACILIVVGVGLFGTFTGFIASLFVQPELTQDESAHERVLREIRTLDSKLSSLEAKLDKLKNDQRLFMLASSLVTSHDIRSLQGTPTARARGES
jgi:voltage-gated potassium channel